ncbi:NitT/TauT family transport system substrate-binding protein [Motilibacter rhizosphaerae]|uniref:NitT/TauT family transport system substrate-binding protein n=1 Tax=Motilibacter rhizosphaerae TaxID=598652 RepID=A0A4Q7NRK4_9ACTN|nr:ABC transporter substrate-binding protein [Motilibacter rhizosphaerae]RZS89470.1 NitT/TauT family transport system substrate-binding protein [Motilibacter rhizosphaerae]
MLRTRFRRALVTAVVVPLLPVLAACASADKKSTASTGGAAATAAASSGAALAESPTLKLGYFANVTHAAAVVGASKEQPFFQKALGSTKLSTQIYNAGPAAIEALTGGTINAAFLGPNPAINGYVKAKGGLLRIVSGATSGGASLVVRASITSAAQLKGKKIADPQQGGTQDVALRYWLQKQGFKVPVTGKGDVSILNLDNAATLDQFKLGRIDGAWVPEPWASRLVDAGAKTLVDEKTQWPGGKFVTTHLVVSQDFLKKYPGSVKKLLQGELAAEDWITANPDQAQTVVNDELKTLTGKALKPAILASAFKGIGITMDPLASTLQEAADHAVSVGLLKKPDLKGIYDLSLLNEVLKEAGKPAVDDAGLGV